MRVRSAKRMSSLLMSGIILLTNLLSPVVAYADEVDVMESSYTEEAATEVETEKETEIHIPQYTLTIPHNGDVTFKYDKSRTKSNSSDIVLLYKPEEMVSVSVLPNNEGDTLSCSVVDDNYGNVDIYWKSEDTLYFQMPEKNVRLDVTVEKSEIPLEETEMQPVTETVTEEEEETELITETDTHVEIVEEAGTETAAETEQVMTEETVASDQNEDMAAETEAAVVEESTESTGLPEKGSIETVEPVQIPFDTWDFDPRTDFRNIAYDEMNISYISDSIVYETPGTYDSVYKVEVPNSELFWFVVRPVIVLSEGEVVAEETETEVITEIETEIHDQEKEVTFEETGAVSEAEDSYEETVTESETEDVTETATEEMTEAVEKVTEAVTESAVEETETTETESESIDAVTEGIETEFTEEDPVEEAAPVIDETYEVVPEEEMYYLTLPTEGETEMLSRVSVQLICPVRLNDCERQ